MERIRNTQKLLPIDGVASGLLNYHLQKKKQFDLMNLN